MNPSTIRTIVLCVLAMAIDVLIGLNVPLPSYDQLIAPSEPIIVLTPAPQR